MLNFKFLQNTLQIVYPWFLTTDYEKTIFKEGWNAYHAGVRSFDNPYQTAQEKELWEEGWFGYRRREWEMRREYSELINVTITYTSGSFDHQ
jgi:hypothetical protein